jgi:hypothetical protein
MLNGNLYGLIITLLTFVITVILTMRQVQETGVRFEVVIQPVAEYAIPTRARSVVQPQSPLETERVPQTSLKQDQAVR